MSQEKKNISLIKRLCTELVRLGDERAMLGSKCREEMEEREPYIRKRISEIKLKLIDFVVVIPKSDEEILSEVNQLALVIAAKSGWCVTNPKQLMFTSQNQRAKGFWKLAQAIYEHQTSTEVADAVSSFEERQGG